MSMRTYSGALCGSLVIAFILATFAPPAEQPDMRRRKKLIAVGWDLYSDTQWIRKHHIEMQKRPFDGIVINVVGRREDGTTIQLRQTLTDKPWKYDWFQEAVDDLKACRWTTFTDNFIMVHINPGNVDWFDDKVWPVIIEHWQIAARVARESGATGICFDPEPYNPPYAPFRYGAPPGNLSRYYEEYAAKVRARGREIMEAVSTEYPDITILSLFLNSICGRATGHANPMPVLAKESYGLLPAFVDGWLDVIPSAMTLVDGHEHAYRYNSELQFLQAANLIRGVCQELVSPENRAKYRAQVQTGFGIYLDAHTNPSTSPWYIDPEGGPRVDRLKANVTFAVNASDEYVWIYGETASWWPTPHKRAAERTWPEALPGCEKALRWARDPIAAARWTINESRKGGTPRNLLANGDFSVGPTGKEKHRTSLPASWSNWQVENSTGTFGWDPNTGRSDNGSVAIRGVAHGCMLQGIDVKPGQQYAVMANRRLTGNGDAFLVIRWQAADGKWTAQVEDITISCAAPREEWGELFGVARVPEGANKLVVLLLVHGQLEEKDTVWFDDAIVYCLDNPDE